jgi:hypothetical protein
MTVVTSPSRQETLTRAAWAMTLDRPTRPLAMPGPFRRAAIVVGDLLWLAVIALCIPFVIMAIGTPIALFLRFLLWLVGML